MANPPKVAISSEEIYDFLCLRNKIFELIDRSIAIDGHHKSYEGRMSIVFPNRFEDTEGVMKIKLDCYVLGPTRHYYWAGKTLQEATNKARKDVDQWEKEVEIYEQECDNQD